ncbi:MAG: ABC transporter ATP-binding protein [Candidatus Eisenbacteria bacterium]|nr:ABC transporter ATP-binding protein [Candidatus Eisenbacteria bacterium]
MTGDAAISIRGLARRFGALTAVDELTFDVRPGELFGLVGPDGAGKTTTLRMLAGVLPPSAGDALVFGASVARESERVKRDLAYMSQRFGLYGDLTVRENLDFYADLYEVPPSERAARLERLWRFSNLEPFANRLAGQLSGGMKQKLGLSCALVHEPRVLLLDEPTFGVDPVSRRDLWMIVHEMVARGVTAVVSTAYLDEAERFDRLALLNRGRVVALDAPEALQRTLTGRLFGFRAEPLRVARAAAEAVSGVRRAAVFGDWLHVTAAGDAPARVQAALLAAGCEVSEHRPIEPTLEDVFLDRVAGAEVSGTPS